MADCVKALTDIMLNTANTAYLLFWNKINCIDVLYEIIEHDYLQTIIFNLFLQ